MIVDLCCGRGGWVIKGREDDFVGFDIVDLGYPGQLVLQDVRTLDGHMFRDADLIVASPPCQSFSRMATLHGARDGRYFDISLACFDICLTSGVPWVIENVEGARDWFGPETAHFGSFYLWGPAVQLIPQYRGKALKCSDWAKRKRDASLYSKIPQALARAIIEPYSPTSPLTILSRARTCEGE